MAEIISKNDAIGASLKFYFTGNPCNRGHLSKRFVSSGNCYQCCREDTKSEKGRAKVRRRYARRRASPEHAKRMSDANRRYAAEYLKRPEVIERRKAYCRTDEYKLLNRRRHLRSYGLTPEQFEAMASSQNYVCAICGDYDPKGLHIDHCHATGRIRGLLCVNCNTGIGSFKDDHRRLERAIAYLGRALDE